MITKEEFDNLALLSKLCVTEEEYALFSSDLQQMIEFADVVRNAPCSTLKDSESAENFCPVREDTVEVSYDRKQVLENSALTTDEFFVVRKRG